MKRQPRILAGTAIGLFMASAPLSALPLPHGVDAHFSSAEAAMPLIRVQADCQEGESAEACAARQGGQQEAQPRAQEAAPEPKAEQPKRKQRREAPAEQAAPQEQPASEAEQPRRKQRREAPAEQAAPQEQPAPEAEQPRRKQRREAPAEQAAPQEQPAPEAERPRRNKKQDAPVEEAAPQAQPAIEAAPEPQVEQPAPKRKPKRDAPAEQTAPQTQPVIIEAAPEPQTEQPAPKRKPKRDAPVEQAAPAEKPVEKPADATPDQVPTPAPAPEAAAPLAPSSETPAPAEKPSRHRPTEKPAEATPEQVPAPAPAPDTKAPEVPAGKAPMQTEQPGEQKPAEQPATGEQPATPQQPETGKKPTQQGEAPVNPNEAPLLDSQKETPPPAEAGRKPGRGEKPGRPGAGGQSGEQAAKPQPEPVDPGPPPVDDKAATEAAQPADIQAVTAEKGTRNKRGPDQDIRRRPRPEGTEVLREIGDRLIIQVNNQVIVESNDRPRMTRDAQEVYYEDLPRGRTRETIVRPNGNQIITIRNRYGDIVRRSRITPDGREYVLSYVEDQYHGEMDEWRDPGLDLPPLRLHIPRNEYILDAQYVEDPDVYYDFLEQPPVERVQRLYSVDEVKRSARVRDIARRVDLDTLTFEFGSASISESEIAKLEGVANAMERLLEKNPAETFLIEGHTDAVGSDVANLALSDRRAEAVADALTNVFGIAPENLSTQGYGETYLKVKSQKPERENRRVAIRRITPLVAPVASAQ